MKHGDLRWATLPDRGGHEQRGRRPVIIWQDTEAFPALATAIVIPLTSRQDALRFGGTVAIQPSPSNKLTTASVALVFQLGACDVRRLAEALGRLDDSDLSRIREVAARLQKMS